MPNSYSGYGNDPRGNEPPAGYGADPRGNEPPRPDRDGASDRSSLIPEGTYPVKAVKHRWGWTNGKTPHGQIGILLSIIDGEFKGRTLLYYGNFHANSQEITIKALRALGWRGEDPADMRTLYDGACDAVVEHDEWEGKWRAKVKWLNNADVVMKNEMNSGELKSFAAQFRGLFRANPGSGGGAAPAPSSGPGDAGNGGMGRDDFGWQNGGNGPHGNAPAAREQPPAQQSFENGRDRGAPAQNGPTRDYNNGGQRWGGESPTQGAPPPYGRGRG